MARLLIVSNRSPVTVSVEDNILSVDRSTGGLVSGFAGLHEQSDSLWIGWTEAPNDLRPDREVSLSKHLDALRIVPVTLTSDEVEHFYEGTCNSELWPLFHYLVDQVPFRLTDFPVYERVNERFAEVVATHYREGDLVWIHDYQLMRVPHLLRSRIPEARIGFFLHIPFPSSARSSATHAITFE
jgi:trehalose 6-phosphate synthase/phosphatase